MLRSAAGLSRAPTDFFSSAAPSSAGASSARPVLAGPAFAASVPDTSPVGGGCASLRAASGAGALRMAGADCGVDPRGERLFTLDCPGAIGDAEETEAEAAVAGGAEAAEEGGTDAAVEGGAATAVEDGAEAAVEGGAEAAGEGGVEAAREVGADAEREGASEAGLESEAESAPEGELDRDGEAVGDAEGAIGKGRGSFLVVADAVGAEATR